MRDMYETVHGIYNHSNTEIDRPLALIAMQYVEDATTGSLLHERISQYHVYQVYKHFGINIKDFLDLPTDIVEHLLELSSKEQRKESTAATSLLSSLNSPNKGD